MSAVIVSPKGTLATASTFVDLFRPKPPCTLNYMTEDAKQKQWKTQEPTCLSFSSFPTIIKKNVTKYAAGDHVAIRYSRADSCFFSAAVVRCDTWSIQWVISNTDCLHNSEIQQLVVLTADVVCGIYQNNKRNGLFLGSRHHIATVSKQENKADRSYVAPPRSLDCSFDTKDIVTVAAGAADKLLVLSDKGTIFIVDVGVNMLRSTDAITVGDKVLVSNLKNVKTSSKLIVSHVDEFTHVIVFSPNDTSFEVVTANSANLSEATCTTVKTTKPITNVEMAGPYHALATCSSGSAIQFFTMLPGEAGTDVSPLDVMSLPYTLVATAYNATEQSHTLLCLPSAAAAAKERQESLVNSLVSAVLPFSEGPYSAETLRRAQWAPLPNTFKHYGMSDNQQGEEASLSELMRGDLLQLQNAGSSDGTWVPFQMFYVLASTNRDAVVNKALFSVKAAASVHSRLAKQWHNATTGLHALMTQSATELSRVLSMPWNPRHLRRALRLMSSEQLAHTFHTVAECLRATMAKDAATYYKDAATAALGVALHITTLSNQIGVALDPKDVETVASLLRASREAGHEVTRYAGRMELQLDACLQRRSMRRLLASHMQSRAAEDEQLASLQGDFFGIPADLQVERTLLTRFAANSWAQYLGEGEEEHRRIAASAADYLQQVEGIVKQQGGADSFVLGNWEEKGKRPCGDKLMNEFESTLVHIHH